MSAPLLKVEDLHVWFDLAGGGELHAVQGVGFELREGDRLGLVGESGCGKTTAILSLMGLLPSSASVAGRVLLDGEDILFEGERSVSPHRWKDIAMVFQGAMNAFNPVKRIGEQIAEPMKLHDIADGRQAKRQVGELLERVGIPAARASSFPHEFSGGMRQRAAIAMSLACKPRILLAVMYAGEIVEEGPTDTLFHDPRHPYTRLLFSATPDLYGEDAVVSIPGAPPRLDHELTGCPFQPRCDRAFTPCATVKPRLIQTTQNHTAACHLNDNAVRAAS